MRVLDLFSGLGGWSAAFRDRGHHIVTVDNDPRFHADYQTDVLDMEPEELSGFDVTLASPPCNAFSIARVSENWTSSGRPKSAKAHLGIALALKAFQIARQSRFFVIENPRAMMRTTIFGPPNIGTVTMCQYGGRYMKPTDLWGRLPSTFIPKSCRQNSPCHEPSTRGGKTGFEYSGIRDPAERARIPYGLSLAVCIAIEEAV